MYVTFDNQIGIVTNETDELYIVVYVNDNGKISAGGVSKHVVGIPTDKELMIARLKGRLPDKGWSSRLDHFRRKFHQNASVSMCQADGYIFIKDNE